MFLIPNMPNLSASHALFMWSFLLNLTPFSLCALSFEQGFYSPAASFTVAHKAHSLPYTSNLKSSACVVMTNWAMCQLNWVIWTNDCMTWCINARQSKASVASEKRGRQVRAHITQSVQRYSIFTRTGSHVVGASDDAVSCAVMLEVLHSLANQSTPLLHGVIFLFNGAEENVLQVK